MENGQAQLSHNNPTLALAEPRDQVWLTQTSLAILSISTTMRASPGSAVHSQSKEKMEVKRLGYTQARALCRHMSWPQVHLR